MAFVGRSIYNRMNDHEFTIGHNRLAHSLHHMISKTHPCRQRQLWTLTILSRSKQRLFQRNFSRADKPTTYNKQALPPPKFHRFPHHLTFHSMDFNTAKPKKCCALCPAGSVTCRPLLANRDRFNPRAIELFGRANLPDPSKTSNFFSQENGSNPKDTGKAAAVTEMEVDSRKSSCGDTWWILGRIGYLHGIMGGTLIVMSSWQNSIWASLTLEFEGNEILMCIQYERFWLLIDLIGVLAGNFHWRTDGEEGRLEAYLSRENEAMNHNTSSYKYKATRTMSKDFWRCTENYIRALKDCIDGRGLYSLNVRSNSTTLLL